MTRKWLESSVVGGSLYNRTLCPFAARPWKRGGVKLVVSPTTSDETLLRVICEELRILFPRPEMPPLSQVSPPVPETSLIIAPLLFENDYRKMIHFSWKVMEHISSESSLAGKVQVQLPKAMEVLYTC